MRVVVNASIGLWYTKGTDRLMNSLNQVGYAGSTYLLRDQWPLRGFNEQNLYNLKAATVQAAKLMGYKQILWADSSMWAVRNPVKIFEIIERDGFYVESNGMNAAQECSDKCLEYFGTSRDEAAKIPMVSSGLIGMDLNHSKGKEFVYAWVNAAYKGVFDGSRHHDNQSSDSRFLHHRQDQSAASLIIHQLGIKILPLGTHWNYDPNETENTIFKCRGM